MAKVNKDLHIDYATLVRRARAVTLALLAALLLLLTYQTLISPSFDRSPSVFIWLIFILPLLALLPGLIKTRYTSFIWLCYIDLLYFMVAVTNVMGPHFGWVAAFEVGIDVCLFISAMYCARWIKVSNAQLSAQWRASETHQSEP